MKKYFLLLIIIIFGLNLKAQTILPIKFKSNDQSTAKPDEDDGELYFMKYYIAQPINVYFDGLNLNIYTDSNRTILNTKVKTYTKTKTDEDLVEKWTLNISNNDSISRYDTIQIIVDYRFKFLQYQLILPTKDKYGENYTSYRKYSSNELAIK